MKTTKEYNVSKLEVGDDTFYFLGNDYMVVSDRLITFKKKGITNYLMNEEEFKDFKNRLDYIADNDLTITL